MLGRIDFLLSQPTVGWIYRQVTAPYGSKAPFEYLSMSCCDYCYYYYDYYCYVYTTTTTTTTTNHDH